MDTRRSRRPNYPGLRPRVRRPQPRHQPSGKSERQPKPGPGNHPPRTRSWTRASYTPPKERVDRRGRDPALLVLVQREISIAYARIGSSLGDEWGSRSLPRKRGPIQRIGPPPATGRNQGGKGGEDQERARKQELLSALHLAPVPPHRLEEEDREPPAGLRGSPELPTEGSHRRPRTGHRDHRPHGRQRLRRGGPGATAKDGGTAL